eukprot:TRINITY_DN95_c0_g1_i8.p1 TRINITY_DN95_c0_g1~~TRINITY_DN95_c0_g1_i8.p1  ORF type:complete len:225 (+),score=78.55 TRINITY_DN95_c0_g1_i8:62-676(+)
MTGLAEPIRLAFEIGGIEFEDERIEKEQFEKIKSTLPYGSLPYLTLGDGEIIAQSNAILRYVGRQTKLYPEDNLQATRIDELIDAVGDILPKIFPTVLEKDPEIKKQGIEKINNEVLPHWVNLIEKRIEKYGKGGYSVGDHLTIADLKLYMFFGGVLFGIIPPLREFSADSIKSSPRLLEVINKVKDHPKVVEWNKKHNSHLNL